jgi:hypothetical protein
VLKRRPQVRPRRLDPANGLHHNIDFGIADYLVAIGRIEARVKADSADLSWTSHGNAMDE